ncbi:tyrosine phosphatase family protein [Methylorubrum zatmanii]|uniref:Tyrosine phosphatase family protein n=1 Tax=Methylorubrum zatmanii TaxID=29429 RepID=A0ABW1WPR2_9HYPH|nr:protein tyrosine phosphatase [Methylorubrum zatmanii]MBD8907587.1 protein tyrosine phosphatase [Methylorubrum zatmanii]
MPTIHICPLSRLAETVAACDASHLVTLATLGSVVARPASIRPEHHLRVGFSDITAPREGHLPPGEEHVRAVLDFVGAWPAERPLVMHCYAGISRSTAAAYAAACALRPDRDEDALAEELRRLAPSATPNRLFVEIADRLLGREGRMSAAIARIGRGAEAFEGTPFRLTLR